MATFIPPSQQPQNKQNTRRERGTGFTNLKRILGANVGAGEKIGSAIGGIVGNRTNQFQTQTQSGLQNFKTKADSAMGEAKSALAPGEVYSREGSEIFERTPGMSDEDFNTGKAAADTAYRQRIAGLETPTDEQANTFSNAAYAGPKDVENRQGLTQTGQSLRGLGSSLGRSSGRFGMLKSIAAPGPYGLGSRSLDNALLGTSKSGLSAIQEARQKAQSVAGQELSKIEQAENTGKAYERSIQRDKKDLEETGLTEFQGLADLAETQGKNLQTDLEKLSALMGSGIGDVATQTEKLKTLFGGQLPTEAEVARLMTLANSVGFDAGDSGFGGSSFYGTQDEINNLLASLSSTFQAVPGSGFLDEPERKAMANINKMFKQGKTDEDINTLTRPEDLTEGDATLFGANAEQRQKAEEAKAEAGDLSNLGLDLGGLPRSAAGAISQIEDGIRNSNSNTDVRDLIKNILWNNGLGGGTNEFWVNRVISQMGPRLQAIQRSNDLNQGRYNVTASAAIQKALARLRGEA